MDWAEDRLEELKRLWVEEALTSSQIAERMGITRGTVLGKINRLGLLRHLAVQGHHAAGRVVEIPVEPHQLVVALLQLVLLVQAFLAATASSM